jgi:hypothetical protein
MWKIIATLSITTGSNLASKPDLWNEGPALTAYTKAQPKKAKKMLLKPPITILLVTFPSSGSERCRSGVSWSDRCKYGSQHLLSALAPARLRECNWKPLQSPWPCSLLESSWALSFWSSSVTFFTEAKQFKVNPVRAAAEETVPTYWRHTPHACCTSRPSHPSHMKLVSNIA